jgi:hypothetical protein
MRLSDPDEDVFSRPKQPVHYLVTDNLKYFPDDGRHAVPNTLTIRTGAIAEIEVNPHDRNSSGRASIKESHYGDIVAGVNTPPRAETANDIYSEGGRLKRQIVRQDSCC